MNLQNHKFKEVSIYLNNHCNLKCKYCFLDDKFHYEISTDTLINTLEFIKQYADPKGFHLHIFGTEPLLSWDKLYTAIKWVEGFAPHWGVGITSNMTLMTYARAWFLAKHNVYVLASLDGMEESHNKFRLFRNNKGSFNRVMRGIRNFSYHSDKFGIAMTMTPENLPNLLENVQFAYGLKPKPQFIALNKIIDHWDTSYDSKILYKKLKDVAEWWIETDPSYPLQFLHKGCVAYHDIKKSKKSLETSYRGRWTCGALWGSFGIRWDGTIFPCHRMVEQGWDIGHISTDLDPSWITFYRSLDSTQCHLCSNFSCGTCFVHNYYTSKSIYKIPPSSCAVESIRNQLVRDIYPAWLNSMEQKNKMTNNEQSPK